MVDFREKRFSAGILAYGDLVVAGCEEAYLDYLQLRANVYIKKRQVEFSQQSLEK